MAFLELAKKRCSVRAYEDRTVEQEKVDAILEAARVAPSAANRQPVRVIVVRGDEALSKLDRACNRHGAPLAFIVCADRGTAWTRPYDDMQTIDIDASIACDHMMLEAADQGVGSVWICMFDPDVIREEFGLAENVVPVNILAAGYSSSWKSPERHAEDRHPVEDFVTYA